ncbi:MAG TPA: CD225/dispanin family protein [Candidatus Hydrogenedentes bacterium]|nr:CD225/dispanin family protein [Candidatus Hydrogenedentota bacterium]
MKNYLVESIVVTICCCLPFGIAAIVFAAQVNGKLQAGDIAGAQDAANKAKMFCWIGFGIGLLVNLIVIIVQALAVMASSGAQM